MEQKIASYFYLYLILHVFLFAEIKAQYPADISFCIADIKFDGENIKICEFGQGSRSKFKGYDILYGKGKIWTNLAKYLSKFQKPFFIVTPEAYCPNKKGMELNRSELEKLGGQIITSIGVLDSKDLSKKNSLLNTSDILNYDKIVITHETSFLKGFFADFRLRHPEILVADQATAFFVNSKYETNELFKNPKLQKYRPKSIVCKTRYHEKMIKDIIKKIDCKKYVIKPLDSSRGSGVIIVDKLHLNRELKKILLDKDTLDKNDATYKFWATTKDKQFLIEEFVSSKIIVEDGKHFDATMRVVFVMCHSAGEIDIDFLGAYWKLPMRALEEFGGLTLMHKSNINTKRKSAAEVSTQDFEIVKKEMRSAMQIAYPLMLKKRKLDLELIS